MSSAVHTRTYYWRNRAEVLRRARIRYAGNAKIRQRMVRRTKLARIADKWLRDWMAPRVHTGRQSERCEE